jgi:hypothetical protein
MATEDDEREAVQRLLVGLSSGQDVFELSATISELHRKNNTFPGEVYVRLAAEVLADTRAAGAGPIEYEGLREVHLEDVEFRGKENRKFQYAVLCSGSVAGGLEPDLLDEVVWWGTDDFWRYALLAAVALVRASAVARQLPVRDIVAELAHRRSVTL